MLRFFRIYGMSIVMSLFILYMSVIREMPSVLPSFSGQDKVLHGGAYAVLALLLCYELYRQRFVFTERTMALWGIVYPIVYGGLIEILQANFFPPRQGDWVDWLADIIGVVIGFLFAKFFVPKIFKPEGKGLSCR